MNQVKQRCTSHYKFKYSSSNCWCSFPLFRCSYSEAATRRVPKTKMFLEISQNSLATWFNSPEACNFIKKETLTLGFPCEFCEIFKNTYFEEHLRTAGFDYLETSQKNIEGGALLKYTSSPFWGFSEKLFTVATL